MTVTMINDSSIRCYMRLVVVDLLFGDAVFEDDYVAFPFRHALRQPVKAEGIQSGHSQGSGHVVPQHSNDDSALGLTFEWPLSRLKCESPRRPREILPFIHFQF